MTQKPVGTFCLVLHTHLPWLAHGGSWPVGEEWLHQAWAQSYLPVTSVLRRLASDGYRDVLTLGLTPVVAAQLDDPYCLAQFHHWLGDWQARAAGLATRSPDAAAYEFAQASRALEVFESQWVHGGSPVLRSLADDGTIELLGGPLTHPFQPLLDERIARFALSSGLDDAALRFGHRPRGMWAPECAYAPGLEGLYARTGVTHFVLDGPTLIAGRQHDESATRSAWTVGDSSVVGFGRDLSVTYRVWSPRRGYPGGRYYRDFHTFDHPSGFRLSRVTSVRTPPEAKRPYDPALALGALEDDVEDFVSAVRARLAAHEGGLVVCAYDTELFGHWWHEGPVFLDQVLRKLPGAGIRVTTLSRAIEDGAVAGRVDPPAGSWGSGKDWHVWTGSAVADMVAESERVQKELLDILSTLGSTRAREPDLDQLVREALLALASDWSFMVSKDSAPDYARRRFAEHVARFRRLADAVRHGRGGAVARELALVDGLFGHLDARSLWHDLAR